MTASIPSNLFPIIQQKTTNKNNFSGEFQFYSKIQGIPCIVDVVYYYKHEPSDTFNSDWDFHGYVEFEFNVFDKKGYLADWLLKKLTDSDYQNILAEYESKHH